MNKFLEQQQPSFQTWLTENSLRLEQGLTHYLKTPTYPAPALQQAMFYACLNGGKRIRPLLIYASGSIFNAPAENLDLAALAIELIHSYSLVHDDLPAMDNAELRRGKLSCFKTFGEDLAILVGDALQTLAFEILASHPAPLSSKERLKSIHILSKSIGPWGMVSGQALDILNTSTTSFSEEVLKQLYQLKTGALIQASVSLGLVAASVKDPSIHKALEEYAKCISLAFQIQDDILDIEGQEEHIGKPTHLDQKKQKITYPMIIGLENAKKMAQLLFQQAFKALQPFGANAYYLWQLTEYVMKRDY